MGVKLTTEVVSSQVEPRLVDERDDLEVRRCTEELNASNSTLGDQASSPAGLRAPRDLLAFGVTDSGRTSWGSPNTPVYATSSEF